MTFYSIGDTIICWNKGNFPLELDENTLPFVVREQDVSAAEDMICYTSAEVQLGQYKEQRLLQINETYELYETERGHLMIYHWATCRFAYGFWLEDLKAGNEVPCYFNPKMREEIPITTSRFFSTAGLHAKLLQRDAVVLHASYVCRNGAAILFTAPSETGKTTQARLWEKYRGAEIINDDRVLLRKYQGVWHAFGYPCCGSSKICKNRTLPLQAVVVLEQGAENRVCALSAAQKIRALVSGIEVYLWDREEIDRSFCLAGQIAGEVPAIKLVCRPDAGAVAALDRYLEEEWYATGI